MAELNLNNMINNLFLDDYRCPKMHCAEYVFRECGIHPDVYLNNEWTVVKNYEEFVRYIEENGLPTLISFDHDLHDTHYAPEDQWERYDEWLAEQNCTEKTGMDCAKWLVDFCIDNNIDLPEYLVHSRNAPGRRNIQGLLDSYKKFRIENGPID